MDWIIADKIKHLIKNHAYDRTNTISSFRKIEKVCALFGTEANLTRGGDKANQTGKPRNQPDPPCTYILRIPRRTRNSNPIQSNPAGFLGWKNSIYLLLALRLVAFRRQILGN